MGQTHCCCEDDEVVDVEIDVETTIVVPKNAESSTKSGGFDPEPPDVLEASADEGQNASRSGLAETNVDLILGFVNFRW